MQDTLLGRGWSSDRLISTGHFPLSSIHHPGSPTSSSSNASANSLEDISNLNWTGFLRPKEEIDDVRYGIDIMITRRSAGLVCELVLDCLDLPQIR